VDAVSVQRADPRTRRDPAAGRAGPRTGRCGVAGV